MLDGDVIDVVEVLFFSFNLQYIDLYSLSWGFDDDGRIVDGLVKLVKKVFEDGCKRVSKNIFCC